MLFIWWLRVSVSPARSNRRMRKTAWPVVILVMDNIVIYRTGRSFCTIVAGIVISVLAS